MSQSSCLRRPESARFINRISENKGTLLEFVGTRASYEPFSQSRGKIKKKYKIIIFNFLSRA